jgi:hypothetical protein
MNLRYDTLLPFLLKICFQFQLARYILDAANGFAAAAASVAAADEIPDSRVKPSASKRVQRLPLAPAAAAGSPEAVATAVTTTDSGEAARRREGGIAVSVSLGNASLMLRTSNSRQGGLGVDGRGLNSSTFQLSMSCF